MEHTYSKDFCAECDNAYRSYACVIAPPLPQGEDAELAAILLGYTNQDGLSNKVIPRLLAWRNAAVRSGIKGVLTNLKTVDYPPSGKEYRFTDGTWTNNVNDAVERLQELNKEGN